MLDALSEIGLIVAAALERRLAEIEPLPATDAVPLLKDVALTFDRITRAIARTVTLRGKVAGATPRTSGRRTPPVVATANTEAAPGPERGDTRAAAADGIVSSAAVRGEGSVASAAQRTLDPKTEALIAGVCRDLAIEPAWVRRRDGASVPAAARLADMLAIDPNDPEAPLSSTAHGVASRQRAA